LTPIGADFVSGLFHGRVLVLMARPGEESADDRHARSTAISLVRLGARRGHADVDGDGAVELFIAALRKTGGA
jgi:hypothetical protein